ncbi:MAG: isochorismatase family protein [Betaproteobacteria bacterium]|nr:isochorismatase family protein [Betaproteobacteria bacterium]
MSSLILGKGDVLVVVDVQNDFVIGSLAVPEGAAVIAPLNRYIGAFSRKGLRVIATRDWRPANHKSFIDQGGPWSAHGVAMSEGAAFVPGLKLPDGYWLVSKSTHPERESRSAFDGTDLARRLKRLGAKRLFVGGLATDHGVLHSVLGARALGYETFVLADAIRAADLKPGEGDDAQAWMQREGALFVWLEDFADFAAEFDRID